MRMHDDTVYTDRRMTTNDVTDAIAVVAARCVRLLVALDADDTVVGRRELLITDHPMTLVALETFRVPLPTLVLELLHSCSRNQLTLDVRSHRGYVRCELRCARHRNKKRTAPQPV